MEITDIRIRKINAEGKMKAVVSVTFDNAFVVHDIKVIESQDKLFIAMPSRKTPDGEFKDIAHPINADTREALQQAILDKFESTLVQENENMQEEQNIPLQ
ncbi:septation regulator SpoVG [Petroclostridium sp. X23]|uniref:septation regulator SpoVG n=1 Tax=Petroclostridium sp. X23 TaxID=3045146 RepID=UPI0024ADD38A|nr:septation regulator SpoVG [Petroclostridium sp. X23]WHH57602.1 septation regulator SpoVG [Petroclostridium sp. X23]